jgi:hypothetical protein
MKYFEKTAVDSVYNMTNYDPQIIADYYSDPSLTRDLVGVGLGAVPGAGIGAI